MPDLKHAQLQQTSTVYSAEGKSCNMFVVTAEYTLCRFDQSAAWLIFQFWNLSFAGQISFT